MKLVAAVFVYKLQHPNYKVTCRVAIDRTTVICGSDDACGNVLLIAKHIVGDTAVSGRVTELSDRLGYIGRTASDRLEHEITDTDAVPR